MVTSALCVNVTIVLFLRLSKYYIGKFFLLKNLQLEWPSGSILVTEQMQCEIEDC